MCRRVVGIGRDISENICGNVAIRFAEEGIS